MASLREQFNTAYARATSPNAKIEFVAANIEQLIRNQINAVNATLLGPAPNAADSLNIIYVLTPASSPDELRVLPGYQKLLRACAAADVDVQVSLRAIEPDPKSPLSKRRPFYVVEIDISQPFSASEDAAMGRPLLTVISSCSRPNMGTPVK